MTDQTMRSLLEVHRTEVNDKDDKRGEVIDSLKLELAEVRAQFTKAREAGDYREATSEENQR